MTKLQPEAGQIMAVTREYFGLEQKEVAKRMGASTANYSRMENGIREPNLPFLWRFCNVFGLHFSGFITIMEYMKGRERNTNADSLASSRVVVIWDCIIARKQFTQPLPLPQEGVDKVDTYDPSANN